MRVIIRDQTEDATLYVADLICSFLADVANPVLGLATGATQLDVYRVLRSRFAEGKVSFRHARFFDLDEYAGLSQESPLSCASYLKTNLFDHVDADPAKIELLNGAAASLWVEAERYEQAIKDAGGIGLQLLGIGRNGHIAFNEPGSGLTSRTQVKLLTEETVLSNRPVLPGAGERPDLTITMGIGTILEAKAIILLATGEGKAVAVRNALEGALGASCPASALQMHPDTTVVLDGKAAALLERREYYRKQGEALRPWRLPQGRG